MYTGVTEDTILQTVYIFWAIHEDISHSKNSQRDFFEYTLSYTVEDN